MALTSPSLRCAVIRAASIARSSPALKARTTRTSCPATFRSISKILRRSSKADPKVGKEVPDFLGLMKSVFDRLDAEPQTVEITDPQTKLKVKVIVNKFVMQYIVANNIGTTVTERFPALFYRAAKGDYTNPAQVWLSESRSGIGSAMSYMMDCASGQTAARREQIAREAKGTLLEDIFNFPFPDVCTAWKAPDLGDEFRAPLKSDVP